VNKKRLLRVFIPVLIILLATILIASCTTQQTSPTPGTTTTPSPGQTAAPTTPVGAETKTVKIGLLGSFTGSYAPYGGPMRDGALNALKIFNEKGLTVNGQKYTIEYVSYDDRTDSKRAVAGLTMMKDMYDIDLIMGPMTSPNCLAVQPMSEARHIVLTNYGSALELTRPGIEWTFTPTIAHSVGSQSIMAYYGPVLGAKTAAMVTQNYATYIDMRQGFLDGCKENNVTLVADELFEMTTMDYSTIIARVRQKNPDILIVCASPANSIQIVKQVYEAGWHVLLVAKADLVSDDLFRVAGPAADEIFSAGGISYWAFKKDQVPKAVVEAMGSNPALYLEVAQRYIDTYGDSNMTQALSYYTLLNSYYTCMMKAGTVDNAEKLRDTMETIEFDDPLQHRRMLPSHRYNAYQAISVYFQSTKGADTFKIMAVQYHTDDTMKTWKTEIAEKYETITQIRARRGY
jgi:branched-chain amino acid transport system substrate-binding protein